jgi:hypothetical protein
MTEISKTEAFTNDYCPLLNNFRDQIMQRVSQEHALDVYRQGIGHLIHGYKLPSNYPACMILPLKDAYSRASDGEKNTFVSNAVLRHPQWQSNMNYTI